MFSDRSCMGIKMIDTLFVDWNIEILFHVLFNDIFSLIYSRHYCPDGKYMYLSWDFKYGALCYMEHFVYEHFYIFKQYRQNKFKV